ncbi:MAG: TIGR00300 family protein [Bryobacteraceae bacterium]|nr:TIGR00300 family protein [Solibacteraceae bacterium]MCL4842136.1 TIGR00300 family protein [Bryobacteraceae bacterium]MCO5352121.1 TIGR00300 family protein [Bryobacteraceae bacterium]HAX44245.1 TIGR00300 family protein [Bryobacterales bacterium]HRJ20186.1 TIGR00300 family protein [Bryobacteraceae bacterium]
MPEQQQLTEVVEAEGHLIDSHIMEMIFDTVVEYDGRFEVERFHIGKTNSEPSHLRLKVSAPTPAQLDKMLSQLLMLGCAPVEGGDAEWFRIERDRCAPPEFYSTTNHRTMVRRDGQWHEVRRQRMDALIVWKDGGAYCVRLRDIRAGDLVVSGMRGIRVIPESKERDRLSFAFMSNGISSERQVETAVRQTANLIRHCRENGQKVVVVAGPVVVHTGGVAPLSALIRDGWIGAILAGNALGVHDAEAAMIGTSLGIRMSDGRQDEHGHRNHMRAINAIYHAGSIAAAVEQGVLTQGVLFECVKNKVPFVLAGSLRDDGPLPDTITDMNAAQDAYAEQIQGAGLVLMLGSMLHSIATGNMLPSWVKTVCVDINPAVATKLSDRGTGQAHGVVTDVGLFLEMLRRFLSEN